MTTFDSDADDFTAPKDNAAFFQEWYPYMRNFSAKRGIHPNDIDDAASIMTVRHVERGTIYNFDADRINTYKGEERPARFKSYLGRGIELDLRGIRDKNQRLAQRELPIGCIEGQSDHDSGPSRTAWLDSSGNVQEDFSEGVNDMIDSAAWLRQVRQQLAAVPPRNAQDRCDLVAFHDAINAQLDDTGEKDLAKIAEMFDIAVTTAHQWWHFYKAQMGRITGLDVPPKRARKLKKNKP